LIANPPAIIRPKKPRIYLRALEGTFIPADRWAEEELKKKKIKNGDIVGAQLSRLRSKGLNRLVHKIGLLCVQNIAEFKYTDAHGAIKRLQIEGNIACDEIGVSLPQIGMMLYRVPRSISFDTMDEGEFHEVAWMICALISNKYWKGMEPRQIETMAAYMVDPV
jgi:hypothetical protein